VLSDVDHLFRTGGPFFFVAGPCVLEDRELNLRVARHVAQVSERLQLPAIFKGSFDKANRSSVDSPRGPGLESGLALLREVRDVTGLPVLTDIHETGQAEAVAGSVDVIQIPAFLSRQTDLILAAAGTGLAVNIKKGQWMAPEEMAYAARKAREGGAERIAVTERGTAFGYGRWVVDMRSFELMREACGCPALFDATHAVQLPAAADGSSGGERRFIESLARGAVAAGADGLYLEVHPSPAEAPSDSASMLPQDRLEPLLAGVLAVRRALADS
jgi:2-dehydro-3-deoxyphosphooctonate aldolase (KDO 8-P synthase)